MYGTRGANGVMIVTTKSGADLEKPIIGVRVETNITQPTKVPSFVDGYRYMELYNEAVTNEGTGNILYTQEQIENTRNGVNPYIWPNVTGMALCSKIWRSTKKPTSISAEVYFRLRERHLRRSP